MNEKKKKNNKREIKKRPLLKRVGAVKIPFPHRNIGFNLKY